MSKPIYMLVLGYNWTEAWYQLSETEREQLWGQVMEIDARAGAKAILWCDSRWADESVLAWGVLEYPDLDSYQRKCTELEELGWFRYISTKSILGTKQPE